MWIVRLALRRPYTFAVFALLLLIIGPLSILNTPTDIFPNIDIPVVSIVWQYQGLSAVDMANRIVTLTERTLTTTVDNIDHIESQSLVGVAVVKVYFQPKVTIATAIANPVAPAARRYDPSLDHHLHRIECADSAARSLWSRPFRTAAQRLRPEFHPHSVRHHRGC
jgi:multidrug efflux pump subunit AcrB